jgi:tRNA A-37 threonylcarbamoyl transferase component Bud32
MQLPAGFELLRGAGAVLAVRSDLAAAARERGWMEAGGLARELARAPAPARGRGATALIDAAGRALLVRRLHHGGALGGLLGERFLRPTRPFRELLVTQALWAAGAPVPEAAFAHAERSGPFQTLAFATAFEADAVDALAFLASAPSEPEILRAARAAGRAVRRFHDRGGRHADLHVKNLLVRRREDGLDVLVIDLDGARITPGLTPEERMSQLMRLYRSLVKRGQLSRVGPRGLARFLSAYCGDDRPLRRALLRRLPHELRKVAVHAIRYR